MNVHEHGVLYCQPQAGAGISSHQHIPYQGAFLPTPDLPNPRAAFPEQADMEHFKLPREPPYLPDPSRCKACRATHLSSGYRCKLCWKLELCHICGFCACCDHCGLCTPGTCGWFDPLPEYQVARSLPTSGYSALLHRPPPHGTVDPTRLSLRGPTPVSPPTRPERQMDAYLQLKYRGPPLDYVETKDRLLDEILFCFQIAAVYIPTWRLLRALTNYFYSASPLPPLIAPESHGPTAYGSTVTRATQGPSSGTMRCLFTFHLRGRTTENIMLGADNVKAWAEDKLGGAWLCDFEEE
ncbi:hypothetical protein A1Q2_01553 [Trichosporon asahii var. asahii CBS 8904]|uniref:Uncharacterized protein n=1 Tax=Trichosporon asahii var. asahii (strain CBS 8904) TaxID=1220162 RepID=K1W570_TRIAC|nr:hypothetical protein A1Q2_01553 [Trichosporon asahii var. asahii CBS 8904]